MLPRFLTPLYELTGADKGESQWERDPEMAGEAGSGETATMTDSPLCAESSQLLGPSPCVLMRCLCSKDTTRKCYP